MTSWGLPDGLLSPDTARVIEILADNPDGVALEHMRAPSLKEALRPLRESGIVIGDDSKLRLNDKHVLAPAINAVVRALPRLAERLGSGLEKWAIRPGRVSIDLERWEVVIERPDFERIWMTQLEAYAQLARDAGGPALSIREGEIPDDGFPVRPPFPYKN